MAKELNGRAPDAGTPLLEVKDLEEIGRASCRERV